MDINPIIVDDSGALAVDARIVIDNAAPSVRNYNHLAILPYPSQHEQLCPLAGGGEYIVRPVHPDDANMLQSFVRGLSPESRYFRFVSSMQELPATMLSRFTLIDYDREMALVALYTEPKTDEAGVTQDVTRIVGVSRYITNPDRASCEFSLVVADEFKGKGLGSRLMLSIMDFAREKGLAEIEGLVLANNPNMLKLMKGLGFKIKAFPEDPDFKLVTHHLQSS
jgi:acetyltransferase